MTASAAPFDFRLDRTAWFGTAVLWLAPADPAPFAVLIARVVAAFPDYPPFGGQFEEVVPHLTVGLGADVGAMRRAEQEIIPKLPVVGRAAAVTMKAESSAGGRWEAIAAFPLGWSAQPS